jgi:hypothetical protein
MVDQATGATAPVGLGDQAADQAPPSR